MNTENKIRQKKYRIVGWLYDILDYPWERIYRQWRPQILADVTGSVLEAGVGTGHNIPNYRSDVILTGIDLSEIMLRFAHKKTRLANCQVQGLYQQDATDLSDIPSAAFDWYISTFLYCVMPDALQTQAIEQMVRILKPEGQFKILEIIYSQTPHIAQRQKRLAPLVQKLYGARFDRQTLKYLQENPQLEITRTHFLKDDTYLLIEGRKIQ